MMSSLAQTKLGMLCAASLGLFAVGGCGQDASVERELRALRREVAGLREDIRALQRAASGSAKGLAVRPSAGQGAAVSEQAEPDDSAGQPALLRFELTPPDAVVYVDGERLPAANVEVTGKSHVWVRIERSGFRTVEQSVRADRDQQLSYRLRRGRGLDQRPPLP